MRSNIQPISQPIIFVQMSLLGPILNLYMPTYEYTNAMA